MFFSLKNRFISKMRNMTRKLSELWHVVLCGMLLCGMLCCVTCCCVTVVLCDLYCLICYCVTCSLVWRVFCDMYFVTCIVCHVVFCDMYCVPCCCVTYCTLWHVVLFDMSLCDMLYCVTCFKCYMLYYVPLCIVWRVALRDMLYYMACWIVWHAAMLHAVLCDPLHYVTWPSVLGGMLCYVTFCIVWHVVLRDSFVILHIGCIITLSREKEKQLCSLMEQIQMYQEMTAVKDQVVVSLTNQVRHNIRYKFP